MLAQQRRRKLREAARAYQLLCELRRKEFGIHPILRDRSEVGQFAALYEKLRVDADKFHEYTRMTVPAFDKLLGIVGERLRKDSIREPIRPEHRLIVTLKFLATGNSLRSLAVDFFLGESTVRSIVYETCEAIHVELLPVYVPFPSDHTDWQAIAGEFYNRWNIPNALGAIDGKHVKIRCPTNSGSLFFNYKQHFSMVLMAVADARSRLIYFSFGSYGHENDAGIFDRSDFAAMLRGNQLNLPLPARLPGTNRPLPYYFIGDGAFPLSTNLMKPFPFRDMDDAQRIFNYRLSRARRIVETAFGIMTARFRLLLRPIESKPERTDGIVKAICCLHNYLIDELGEPAAPTDVDVIAANAALPQAAMRRRNANRAPNDADEMRTTLMNYFMHEGAVPWQNEYAL